MDTVKRTLQDAIAYRVNVNGEWLTIDPCDVVIVFPDESRIYREHYASLDQLAPGDRIWFDWAWREVVATAEIDGEMRVFTGTINGGDVRDFTAPATLLVRRAEQ